MKLVRNQFCSERGNRRGGGVAKKLFTTIISTCCALEVVYNLWMFINFFLCSFREEEGKVRSRTCRKNRLDWIEFTFRIFPELSACFRCFSFVFFHSIQYFTESRCSLTRIFLSTESEIKSRESGLWRERRRLFHFPPWRSHEWSD